MGGLIGKVMAGLLSVSTLMFSSYSGNDARFQSLNCRTSQNYLIVKAVLEKAFDNDFTDVFNCGKTVTIRFKLEIRENNEVAHTSSFRRTVLFTPLQASWDVFYSENGRREIYTDYRTMLSELAVLECSVPRNSKWKKVEIRVESWLDTVELTQPDRTVDLMVLWKFKRPSIRRSFTLPPIS